MGRPRKFDEDQALLAALDLFWTNGYDATSTTALADRMGIGAQSLYNTFGDKRALFERALEHYRRGIIDAFLAPLEAPDAGLAAIQAYFDVVVTALSSPEGGRGCFLVKSTLELATVDAAMADTAREHFDRMESLIAKAIGRAQAAGEITSSERPRSLARHLVVNAAGLSVLARSGATPRALKDAVRVALGVLG